MEKTRLGSNLRTQMWAVWLVNCKLHGNHQLDIGACKIKKGKNGKRKERHKWIQYFDELSIKEI